MCLAVPGYVEKILPDQKAIIRIEDINIGQAPTQAASEEVPAAEPACTRLQISTALLPEPPAIGDYVITHAGFAIRRMDLAEAEETLALLRDMAAAIQRRPQ
mgnify:CR=1 FL=1